MKSIVVNYRVLNDKIGNKNILLLADLHDYPGKRKTSLIEDINNEEADAIVIAGDIKQAKKYIIGSDSQKHLKYFLSGISEDKPVFLAKGNHDLFGANEETEKGYKDLENARPGMVFPLDNESYEFDGIRLTEFHPEHEAFAPSCQESGRALLKFNKDFIASGLVIPNDKLYNILICHNPKIFAQARSVTEQVKLDFTQYELAQLIELSESLMSVDVCFSAHLHNGYIPVSKTIENPEKYMDKGYWEMPIEYDKNGNVTKIRPTVFKKTDMCRGTIFVGSVGFRIIELCDGSYYIQQEGHENDPLRISEEKAMIMIKQHRMTPIVISGGVNKFFNLPIDKAEITKVKLLKK